MSAAPYDAGMDHALSAEDVRRRVAALWPMLPNPGRQQYAVACSGGADSLALTLLMALAFPGQVTALIVDHALREGSAADATQTAGWLAAHDVPHVVLRWDGAKPPGGIQVAARAARYELMAAQCAALGIPALLTAHHLDDQAETLLLALQRGSGLDGLSGIPPRRRLGDLTVLRPLLDVRKTQLEATLKAMGQPWIRDPANADQHYDRVRMRQALALLATCGITAPGLAASAGRLRDASEVVHQQVAAFAGLATCHAGAVHLPRSSIAGASPAFQRVVVRPALTSWLAEIGGLEPRGPDVVRLIDWIAGGMPGGTRELARCRISAVDVHTLSIVSAAQMPPHNRGQ